MEQQADGTMLRVQQLENQLYPSAGPDRMDVADLNGDGLLDIVMSGPRVIYANPQRGTAAAGLGQSIKRSVRALPH